MTEQRMNVAIIGAGFIGTALAQQLAQAGHGVVLLTPRPCSARDIPASRCDVLQEKIVLPANLDAVFYLAQSPYYREFPEQAGHLFGVNTLGAIKAAEAALQAGCRFFFYASTGNVYAPSFSPLSEQTPASAREAYALSKYMAEEALALFAAKMPVCVGRIFGAFGPGQEKMLPALLRNRLLRCETIHLAPHPVAGPDGGLHISFLYTPDLARILIRLAEKALQGESLPFLCNLAGPEPVSLERFSRQLGKALGVAPRFAYSATPRSFDLVADITRITQACTPSFTPLEEALARVAAWAARTT